MENKQKGLKDLSGAGDYSSAGVATTFLRQ
jgi:hypothetical protein